MGSQVTPSFLRRALVLFPALLALAPLACGRRDRGGGGGDLAIAVATSALTQGTGDHLNTGESLAPSTGLTSANGAVTLACQGDGNLVLYRNRTGQPLWMPIWSTNTHGTMSFCAMQSGDGNFVVYLTTGAIWSSGTNSTANAGSTLKVQNDGNVVIRRPDGTAIWSTGTVLPPDRAVFPVAGDGTRSTLQLNRPAGFTKPFTGNSFVSDTDNNRILRVNSDGTFLRYYGATNLDTENLIISSSAEPSYRTDPIGNWTNFNWQGWAAMTSGAQCPSCPEPFDGNYYFGSQDGGASGPAEQTVILGGHALGSPNAGNGAFFSTQIDAGTIRFTFTAYVRSRADTVPDKALIYLTFLDDNGTALSNGFYSLGGIAPTDWTPLSTTMTPPVGARFLRVSLYNTRSPSKEGPGGAFFDALSLIAVNPTGITLHGARGIINADSQGAPADNMIVANTYNQTVLKLTTSGSTVTGQILAGSSDTPGSDLRHLNAPTAVALAPNGDLYIADYGNHRIMKLANGATTMTVFAGTTGGAGYVGDGGPATSARLRHPSGIALDPAGNLYIADRGNYVIRKVDTTGKITTYAGTGQGGLIGDGGPPLNAQFARLDSLAYGPDGYLYISDILAGSIRRLASTSGPVETIVGNGPVACPDCLAPGGRGDGGPDIEAHLNVPTGLFIGRIAAEIFWADQEDNRVRQATCSDRNVCNGTESPLVSAGVCRAGTPIAVSDNNACTADSCNPTTGAVTHTSLSADDGNACTADNCDPVVGVWHQTLTGQACNDGNACTTQDTCTSAGTCVGSTPSRPTSNPCTYNSCDPTSGAVTEVGYTSGTSCGGTSVCDGGGVCEPPPPVLIAPPIDPTHATIFADAIRFIYQGAGAVQTGVAAGTIVDKNAALVSGRVLYMGQPLANVHVRFPNAPQYGETRTRADGHYDLVINTGNNLTLRFEKVGYLSVDRPVTAPAGRSTTVEDVTLKHADRAAPTVTLGSGSYQVAAGSTQTDEAGSRTAVVVVPPGTTATSVDASGNETPLSALNLHMTEYTVGGDGPSSMPGPLAPNTAYTYAVDVSTDGADSVKFGNGQIAFYVDNYLKFPIGSPVPGGYYDKTKNAWVPSDNGVVMKIVSVSNGLATVDTTGSGTDNLGLSLGERLLLGGRYTAGKELWRVPMKHLTSWDCNWPYGPPPCEGSICPGPGGTASGADAPVCQTLGKGSIIECEAQGLGERLPVAGTPFTLNYRSSREPGYVGRRQIHLELTGPKVHSQLKSIDVAISIAGRRIVTSYPPLPNQAIDWTWDGLDGYYRPLIGATTASVTITPNYYGVYYFPSSFGYPSPTPATSYSQLRPANIIKYPSNFTVELINSVPRDGWSMGGWTLSPSHFLDTKSRLLYLGDGSVRKVDIDGYVVRQIAGNGTWNYAPDGSDALATGFDNSHYFDGKAGGIAATPIGEVYISDAGNRVVRRISPGGSVVTVAGQHDGLDPCTVSPPLLGDGLPATQAHLRSPTAVTLGPDGSLYIADGGMSVVRRVGPDGIIHTIAGSACNRGSGGDGGPATAALLKSPDALALGPDGSLYIADWDDARIRRIDPAGTIRAVAGNGAFGNTGIGQLATAATVSDAQGLAVDGDGTLYIGNGYELLTVQSDGILRLLNAGFSNSAQTTDGVQISQQVVDNALGAIGFLPNGNLAYGDSDWQRQARADRLSRDYIRVIDRSGIVRTASAGLWGGIGGVDGAAALQQGPVSINSVAGGPNDSIVVYGNYNVYSLEHPNTQGVAACGDAAAMYLIPGGREGYCFDANGRHLETVNLETMRRTMTFGYSNGVLASITDADGNTTQITRDMQYNQYVIIAPFGQGTLMSLGPNGYVTSFQGHGGTAVPVHGDDGLLTSFTDRAGNVSTFGYATGFLTTDRSAVATPFDSTQTLTRYSIKGGHAVTHATTSQKMTYATLRNPDASISQTTGFSDGTVIQRDQTPDGAQRVTMPDGTVTTTILGPSRRFHMYQPIPSNVNIKLPSQKSFTATETNTAVLRVPVDPSTLVSETTTRSIVGASGSWTRTYDAASATEMLISPLGRTTSTKIDGAGRPLHKTMGDVAPIDATYDRGRLKTVTQGSRVVRLDYQDTYSGGYANTLTDPLGQATTYHRDGLGRALDATFGAAFASFGWDGNDRLTTVTPPGRPSHILGYNPFGRLSSYDPPDVPGIPSPDTTTYTVYDRNPFEEWREGTKAASTGYDSAGRLGSIALSQNGASSTFTYYETADGITGGAAPGRLKGIQGPLSVNLGYKYDGMMVTEEAWSGTVNGKVDWVYSDGLFQKVGENVTDGAGVVSLMSYGYDADGLLVCASPTSCTSPGADAVILGRSPASGLIQHVTVGNLVEDLTYNTYGELATQSVHTANNAPLLSLSYEPAGFPRDALGRITEVLEQFGTNQATTLYQYTAGRLTSAVYSMNFSTEQFGYDGNGNRNSYSLSNMGVATSSPIILDNQDRLTGYGQTGYSYTPNGELLLKSTPTKAWNYYYFPGSNLIVASTSDNTLRAEYLIDGRGRRVGKKLNGTLVKQWLYGDGLRPIAELDGTGHLVSRFVYGSRTNVPDVVLRNGKIYRVISDQVGSPRYAINVNDTTDIPFKATYTAFGVETAAAPDWLPFGFAGGLYDPDTGLVRFGARDYDPQVGRWTSKDPLLFKGRSTNLYAYASGDPVNRRDSRGTADDVDGTQNFFMCAMDLMFCVECAAPELDPFKVAACAECLGKVLGDVDNSSCHKPFGSWDHTVPDPPAPPPMVCPKGSRLYEEHLPWPMLDPGPECIPTCKGDDCPNMCGGDGYDPDIEKLQ